MKLIAAFIAALALAACGHQPPKPQVTTVGVKVKEACIEKAPAKPVYRYGKGEEPTSDKEKAVMLIEDFEAAEQYGNAWEAAATGCIKPSAAPSQTDN